MAAMRLDMPLSCPRPVLTAGATRGLGTSRQWLSEPPAGRDNRGHGNRWRKSRLTPTLDRYGLCMPNGGVPRWQVIRPVDTAFVFISDGASLRLAMADEFESQGVAARPVAELSEAQAFALMNHMSYWFEQRPPLDPRPEPGTVLRDY